MRGLHTPSEAAAVVNDSDIVEIDAGTYTNDYASCRASNLTIRDAGGAVDILWLLLMWLTLLLKPYAGNPDGVLRAIR
jgi:hypothetical protein